MKSAKKPREYIKLVYYFTIKKNFTAKIRKKEHDLSHFQMIASELSIYLQGIDGQKESRQPWCLSPENEQYHTYKEKKLLRSFQSPSTVKLSKNR